METPTPHPSRAAIVAAFAVIYIVWGSTYLAIRVVVETLPPFLSAAIRFLVAGSMLAVFLVWRGIPLPNRDQWRHAAVTGLLLLVGGNGLVMWAEKTIPSGLTALLIALTPVWFAALDWVRPHGAPPQGKTIVGIVVGLAGVVLLVSPARSGPESIYMPGAFAIIAAGVSWAAGSLYSKYQPNADVSGPWMNSAAQMICGGIGLLAVGLSLGEPFTTNWSQVSWRSLGALAYLLVFGSWIGFSTYVYLLRVSTPSRVSTYAYVNPVIAVFLGWLLLDEVINTHMVWGALVILAGVIIITMSPGMAGAVRAFTWSRIACFWRAL